MARYPIHLNYEMDKEPVGFVELNDDVSKALIDDGALVPYLVKHIDELEFSTTAFGLVLRTSVNTSPRRL